jgi:predicted PurR-regulated permease PerM
LMILIILLVGTIVIGKALAIPASSWSQELPKQLPELKERLDIVRTPMEPLQKVLNDAQNLAQADNGETVMVTVQKTNLSDRFITSTQHFVVGLFETLVILFFLLVSGDTFLRRLVEILPRFQDKKQAITISYQIQHDLSVYLMTITIMNAIVGALTAFIMGMCGVDDPFLWGILAFIFNYVPILGPVVGVLLFSIVGMMSEPTLSAAMLPAVLYLAVHITESQFVTPMLLARHFTLNPVLVILSLLFFYWMWGIPGAILATPIIAIIKIICDHIEKLKPFGHFIEG